MNYRLHRDNDNNVIECNCCKCKVPTDKFLGGPPFTTERTAATQFLCEFCSTTKAASQVAIDSTDEIILIRKEIWRAAAAVANFLKHGTGE